MKDHISFALYAVRKNAELAWWLVIGDDAGAEAWQLDADPTRKAQSSLVAASTVEGPERALMLAYGPRLNAAKAEGVSVRVMDRGRGQIVVKDAGFIRLQLRGGDLRGFFGLAESAPDVWVFGESVTEPSPDAELAKRVKIDETPNEFRVRLREPSGFQSDSFRRITLRGERPRVFGIVGRPMGATTTRLQALRFPKGDGWTAERVQDWIARHPNVRKFDVRDDGDNDSTEPQEPENTSKRTIPIIKSDRPDEERFVMGIVLVPEERDSQGDIYSADEVRRAAHWFMENAMAIGKMHNELLGQGAVVLENFVAPQDFAINGQVVKQGTWVLAVRVKDDDVWKSVKSGELTGFSIGGSAIRVPERNAA